MIEAHSSSEAKDACQAGVSGRPSDSIKPGSEGPQLYSKSWSSIMACWLSLWMLTAKTLLEGQSLC
jgi:hypothetical protein